MDYFTGKELKAFLAKREIDRYKKRFMFDDLVDYLHDSRNTKVMCLYGLRRTGKTVMMAQLIKELDNYDNCLYLVCNRDDTICDIKKRINENGCKYVFIDEATKMQNFINTCSVLADIYAFSGKKIIMAGTDSLGFRIASKDELFDRVILKHTTYISYREFYHILGLSIDDYIQYGGTLSLEGIDYNNYKLNDENPFYEYLDGAIIDNITHSLKNWDQGRKFGHLQKLYDDGDLESAIRKVIERANRDFLVSTINNGFVGEIRGSLLDLIDKHETIDTNYLRSEELKQRTRIMLRIREPLYNKVSQEAVDQIITYLLAMDVMIQGPAESEYIFTQPGLRYYHARVFADALDADEYFKNYSKAEKVKIKNKLDESVKGVLLEDIIYTQLIAEYKQSIDNYDVAKFSNNMGSEFDVVISDFKRGKSLAIEIKHSSNIDKNQIKHLMNEEFCKECEDHFGTKIVSKIVVYNGNTEDRSGVSYINAQEFLTRTEEIIEDLFIRQAMSMSIKAINKDDIDKIP